jgi:hypothetical protein
MTKNAARKIVIIAKKSVMNVHAFGERGGAAEEFDADLPHAAGIVQLRHGEPAPASAQPKHGARLIDGGGEEIPIVDEEGEERDEQHFAEEGRERRLLRQRPLRARQHDRNDDQRIEDIGHVALDQAEAGIGDRQKLIEERIDRCRIHRAAPCSERCARGR